MAQSMPRELSKGQLLSYIKRLKQQAASEKEKAAGLYDEVTSLKADKAAKLAKIEELTAKFAAIEEPLQGMNSEAEGLREALQCAERERDEALGKVGFKDDEEDNGRASSVESLEKSNAALCEELEGARKEARLREEAWEERLENAKIEAEEALTRLKEEEAAKRRNAVDEERTRVEAGLASALDDARRDADARLAAALEEQRVAHEATLKAALADARQQQGKQQEAQIEALEDAQKRRHEADLAALDDAKRAHEAQLEAMEDANKRRYEADLEEVQRAHEVEREELQRAHEADVETLKEKAKEELAAALEDAQKAHVAALEEQREKGLETTRAADWEQSLRASHAAEVAELTEAATRERTRLLEEAREEEKRKVADLTLEIENLKARHSQEIRAMSDAKAADIEELTRSKRQLEESLEEAKTRFAADLEEVQNSALLSGDKAFEEIRRTQAAEVQALRERLLKAEQRLDEVKVDHNKELDTVEREHQEEMDGVMATHGLELEAVKKVHQRKVDGLQNDHRSAMEALKTSLETAQRSAVEALEAKLRADHRADVDRLREAHEKDRESYLEAAAVERREERSALKAQYDEAVEALKLATKEPPSEGALPHKELLSSRQAVEVLRKRVADLEQERSDSAAAATRETSALARAEKARLEAKVRESEAALAERHEAEMAALKRAQALELDDVERKLDRDHAKALAAKKKDYLASLASAEADMVELRSTVTELEAAIEDKQKIIADLRKEASRGLEKEKVKALERRFADVEMDLSDRLSKATSALAKAEEERDDAAQKFLSTRATLAALSSDLENLKTQSDASERALEEARHAADNAEDRAKKAEERAENAVGRGKEYQRKLKVLQDFAKQRDADAKTFEHQLGAFRVAGLDSTSNEALEASTAAFAALELSNLKLLRKKRRSMGDDDAVADETTCRHCRSMETAQAAALAEAREAKARLVAAEADREKLYEDFQHYRARAQKVLSQERHLRHRTHDAHAEACDKAVNDSIAVATNAALAASNAVSTAYSARASVLSGLADDRHRLLKAAQTHVLDLEAKAAALEAAATKDVVVVADNNDDEEEKGQERASKQEEEEDTWVDAWGDVDLKPTPGEEKEETGEEDDEDDEEDEENLEALRERAQVLAEVVSSLERSLARERELRTSEDAAANVTDLKNSLVTFLATDNRGDRLEILPTITDLLHLEPDEVAAIEARLAEGVAGRVGRGLARVLDAELSIPFFGRSS